MNSDAALQMVGDLLRQGLLLGSPLLLLVLAIGLVVSVLQVVTQIQDPSIAFVPKVIVFVLGLIALAPWMLARLTAYAGAMFARLGSVG